MPQCLCCVEYVYQKIQIFKLNDAAIVQNQGKRNEQTMNCLAIVSLDFWISTIHEQKFNCRKLSINTRLVVKIRVDKVLQ